MLISRLKREDENQCEEVMGRLYMAGVRKGLDSAHIDLSITNEGVPFLWRDHHPRSLTARMKQLGVWWVERYRPVTW